MPPARPSPLVPRSPRPAAMPPAQPPLRVIVATDTLDATQDRTLADVIADANDLEHGGTLASYPVWVRGATGQIIGLQAQTVATPASVLLAECPDRFRLLQGQDFEPEVH